MNKFTLKINGMKCSMCEEHVSTLIKDKVDRAIKVSANHNKNTVIILSDREISETEFKIALSGSGYKVNGYEKELNLNDTFFYNLAKKHYKFTGNKN